MFSKKITTGDLYHLKYDIYADLSKEVERKINTLKATVLKENNITLLQYLITKLINRVRKIFNGQYEKKDYISVADGKYLIRFVDAKPDIETMSEGFYSVERYFGKFSFIKEGKTILELSFNSENLPSIPPAINPITIIEAEEFLEDFLKEYEGSK